MPARRTELDYTDDTEYLVQCNVYVQATSAGCVAQVVMAYDVVKVYRGFQVCVIAVLVVCIRCSSYVETL